MGGSSQDGDGVSAALRGGPPVYRELSPCPSSEDLSYPGVGLLGNTSGLSEAGLSRDRAAGDGMYFVGNVPPGNMLPGTLSLLGEAWEAGTALSSPEGLLTCCLVTGPQSSRLAPA